LQAKHLLDMFIVDSLTNLGPLDGKTENLLSNSRTDKRTVVR